MKSKSFRGRRNVLRESVFLYYETMYGQEDAQKRATGINSVSCLRISWRAAASTNPTACWIFFFFASLPPWQATFFLVPHIHCLSAFSCPMSQAAAAASNIVEPDFPCLLSPSQQGPLPTTAITANGTLLLVSGRHAQADNLDCPNVTTLVELLGLPDNQTPDEVTASMFERLMHGLNDTSSLVDANTPHVALMWDKQQANSTELVQIVCNVVALVLARQFRLRDWEARDAAKACFDKCLPGVWTSSIDNDMERYSAAYTTLAFPPSQPALRLFYGHDSKYAPYHVFSQFYKISYIGADGSRYNCSEKEMHAGKARLFNDHDTLDKIMKSSSPYEHKKLGRQVRERLANSLAPPLTPLQMPLRERHANSLAPP
jgi:hypothetical protein